MCSIPPHTSFLPHFPQLIRWSNKSNSAIVTSSVLHQTLCSSLWAETVSGAGARAGAGAGAGLATLAAGNAQMFANVIKNAFVLLKRLRSRVDRRRRFAGGSEH